MVVRKILLGDWKISLGNFRGKFVWCFSFFDIGIGEWG